MSHLPPRGILRKTNRQATSQSIPNYGPDEVYSHERNINYHSDPANMPIFSEDEDIIQRINTKPQNINANLYAQALAAKSSLGLLDVGKSSALEALRSYDSHIDSPLTSPEKKQNLNLHSSQLSRSSFQQTSGHRPSFYNDLEEEDLSPYKYTGTSRNSDPDHPVSFKPITDLNLNSVDDEDEFLYGDSNPSENSSFQKMRSSEVYGSDDLLDVEAPRFDKYQKSLPFSKSKESNDDGKSGIKLSISSFKKRSYYNDDPIADNRSAKQELSLTSKQYKESFDAYSNSPSALNEGSYEPHSYLHYNLDNQSRSSIPFKTSKESSLNFSELDPTTSKISDSSLNQSVAAEDSTKNYEAAAKLLRKQLNLDKSAKKNMPYEEEFYSKYGEPPQNERRFIYDSEKKSVDKSSSGEPLKFPKLLINVQQGESSPSKRVVQVKESSISSSKYNASLTKSESSLKPSRNLTKNEDLEVDKNVYEPDDLGTRRVVRDKTKVSREPVSVGSKGETRVLPKRYTEKSHKKSDETSMKQRLGEKLPKKYSDKYHFVKEGMESFYAYGSKSKSYKVRSPENRWSPSNSPRHRSPSYSPRRWSPEHYRRRSPSYSPPNSHSRNRSPSYRYRDHSPSYRSRDARRRSPERSSRRERRSHERSPHGHSRYRSRGRSPSWPVVEKESHLSQDGSSEPNIESKKKERTVIKRGRNFTSEEKSDDEQEYSVEELSDKLKGKEPSKILKVSDITKSDVIFSKKRKISIPDEKKEDKPQHPDAVSKIIQGLGITKNTTDPFAQNEKGSEIAQDLPDSKEKRSEVMNSLLNKLGISSSISTITTTVGPATAWTVGSTESQASVSATPQQLNVNQYGMHYPQSLASAVPQMYQQQYMYRASVPPVSHFPPFSTPPPPIYPQPIPSTSAFSYPPPVPPVPNTFSSINFQINPRATNPNSKGRISCLKSIPVVNSNQSLPQPSVVWNQNYPSSPTKLKTPDASNSFVKGVLPKNLSVVSPETSNSSAETEQNMVEKYKKLLEEKETLQKKLKNTSDHIIEIRNLQAELEKTAKVPKSSATKQLNIKCSNLFDRTNEELKRYIDEAKRVSGHLKELQTKIKQETLDKIAKEVPEKKVSSSVKYAGYDAGNHWCEICNMHISTIPKMMEHLHGEMHIKHVDPSKVITKEAPKENFDKNAKLWPAKGVEFIKPLFAFYCSLCDEMISNQSYAEYHLKDSSHIEKYMTFLNENPVYERKRDVFKEAAIVALVNEKKQKDLEEIRLAKKLFQSNNIEIKRQKKQDAIKVISEKLQQLKEKDKVAEELEESNLNARMSPQSQKSGLKLTLINEKGKAIEPLEPAVTKKTEVKPKPKVVYIGRAPNYKPRAKVTEKKSSISSESKNTDSYNKNEDSKNPNTSSKDEHTAPNFTTLSADEKFKSNKKLAGTNQSNSKNQIELPKRIKNIPGCQSEAEAKESEKVGCDSKKQSVESSDMPTDNSEINEAIKNFIRSCKNATPTKVDHNVSDMKTPDLPSKIPSPVSKSSPKKSSLVSESSPKVSSPLESSPKVSSPLESSPKVSPPLSKSSLKVSSSLVSSPSVSSPSVSSPSVSSPSVTSSLPRQQPLSEEEKDFLILGICKSDMEPLAVPRPPPSNLIHNHSDMVAKFQPFPPPVQIPPPNMISKVPPPNITSQVPPPNIISQVPPPNITSQVPPPNITSQVPPPTLVLQWSSEQNQQSNSVLSNVPLSNNNIPSVSKQFVHPHAVDENTGVMDMEIDNDLVCSEIKVGSDISSTVKELPVLELVMNDHTPSSLSADELCVNSGVQQVPDSDVVIKEDDDRLLLKNFLSSLMDSVSEKVGKDLKDGKNSIESISENLLLSSNKTTESNEKSSDHKFNLNPSSSEQSVSFPLSENNEENSCVEKSETDTQRYEQLVTVSSEIAVQYDNDSLSKDIIQNFSKENNSKSVQEMEIEEISIIKEEKKLNLILTSKTTEECHDVKEAEKTVTNSCQSFETETCEFLEQKNNVLVSTSSEGGTSTNDNENERNSLSLNVNQREENVNSVTNSSSSNTTSSDDVAVSSKAAVQYDTDGKKIINDLLMKDGIQNASDENNPKCFQEMEIEDISVNKEEENLDLSLTSKTAKELDDVKAVDNPVTNSCQSFETETCEFLEQKNNVLVSTSSEGGTSTNDNENERNSLSLNVNQREENVNSVTNSSSSNTTSSDDVAVSSKAAVQYDTDGKKIINDLLMKDGIQNASDENNPKCFQEMEIEDISVNKEEENLDLTLTSKTAKEFHNVKEVDNPVTNSCHSFETETCEFLEQKNNVLVSTSSEGRTSTNDNERNSLSLNVNQREGNVNSVMNSSSSNTTSIDDVAVSSKVVVQYDTDGKKIINDPLMKDGIQNASDENNPKCFQEMEIEEISVNKQEENLNLTLTSKTAKEFVKAVDNPVTNSCQSFETETCEFLKQNNNVLVSTSSEGGTSTNDDENERNSFFLNVNRGESNANSLINSSSLNTTSNYDVAVSSEVAAQYGTDEKNCVKDPLIKDVIQNVSAENNSKKSQEMEIQEISVNKEEKNLNLILTSKTEEFLEVKEVEKPVTNTCLNFETQACEFLEQKNNILVSTSSESGTSFTNDNEKVIENERNPHSLNVNQGENNVISLLNSSSSTITTSYDEKLPEGKEKMELIDGQLVAKQSTTSSSIIKIEVKEEKNEPIETFQFENLSNKQTSDIKSEINAETVDNVSSKSSNLTEVAKLDQNFPVKSAESSQVQSLNDFTSENVSNMQEDKETIPSEDSKPYFKKCDSEDIVNKILTDGQPLLNEPVESENQPFTEELKGELNSDTDEYETAES